MKPGTFNKDSQEPVTVNSEETRTTDTNEKVFQKGESCFYKSEHGPFEEGIIESVDNSENPTSYEVRILPRMKETTAKNLYRELPQYYSPGVLQEDPVHENQSNHVVAQNNGPWIQSNQHLNNQLNHQLKRKSAVHSQRTMAGTSTAEPGWSDDVWNPIMYPEAEFGCMSLKSLYQ
jgi:hypothetical protein